MFKVALFFIALYRKIPRGNGMACRYSPSCSEYAYGAVAKFGISGVFVALLRIFRCNQFFKGGVDLVP